jgi:hypothetical protein
VRAATLYRGLTQSFARDWTRAARFCLGLLACLAQVSAPAQHQHASGFATHSVLGAAPATLATSQADAPCPFHAARASADHGTNSPAHCPCGNCPVCPCPCCPSLHAAIGILPQSAARAAYAPSFSATALPPVRLGSALRFAVIAGQPRAPPILI